MSDKVYEVPLDFIEAGDNDRLEFDPNELWSLAGDIRANGQQTPATLRPHPTKDGFYQIIAGERRFRALKLLRDSGDPEDFIRFASLRALVGEYTDEQADALMLSENVHRKDLNPLEEAKAYKKRMDKYGWSIEMCALMCNVRPERIRERLKLLNLMPELQIAVSSGGLDIGKGQQLGRLTKNYQMIAVRALRAKPMRQEEFTKIVSELEAKQNQLSMFEQTLFVEQSAQKSEEELVAELTYTPTTTSIIAVPLGDATIHVVIEHPRDREYSLDVEAFKKSLRWS